MINWANFYLATVADWIRCEIPDRTPDYFSDSGSAYWDYGNRVRRCSDHWGKDISTCCWYIEYQEIKTAQAICGECLYEDFRFKSEDGNFY